MSGSNAAVGGWVGEVSRWCVGAASATPAADDGDADEDSDAEERGEREQQQGGHDRSDGMTGTTTEQRDGPVVDIDNICDLFDRR